MNNKHTHSYMIGQLFFKHNSRNKNNNNKSQIHEDPLMQKFLSFKNKSLSLKSNLKTNPKSRQNKHMNKHLSASTRCSSNNNNNLSLQKSISCYDVKNGKTSSMNNVIKSKVHIRNKQSQLDSVLVHNYKTISDSNNNNNNNEHSFLFGNETSNITQLPVIHLKQYVSRNTKGNVEYAHYFNLNNMQKERIIKTKVEMQEAIFEQLRKEYCFCRSNKNKSSEKDKLERMFDMDKRNGKKVDYFHTGRSKKHIFKYRFKT